MGNRSTFALVIMFVAIGLAIAGNAMLRGVAWGLNLPLWILLTGACGFGLLRKSEVTISRTAKWLALPIGVFSVCFFWRDSDSLKVANGVALFLAVAVLAQKAQQGKPAAGTIKEYTLNLVFSWFLFINDFAELVTRDIDWRKDSPSTKRLTGVLRGLLIAAPLLLVFGCLFVSADAAFSAALQNTFSFDPAEMLASVWFVPILLILVGGFFRRLLWPSGPLSLPVEASAEPKRPFGQTEMVVAFGAVNLLFLSFVLFQFRYLFGGSQNVLQVAGLTYAQYARSGFFELTTVAALTVPMLIGAQAMIPLGSQAFRRWFYVLGSILTGCVFVVIASALVRMNAYVQAYGLTELRFFVTLFVGWIAVTLAWLSVSFIIKKRSFAFGALISGYACILIANCLNPDAVIARTNLEVAKSPDLSYVSRLSLDAAPAIAADSMNLAPVDRAKLLADSQKTWKGELHGSDWRSMNVSRILARRR